MNIQELGSLGEFIAALATLATLFYLATQIRENSKAIKGASYHQAAEQTWQSVLTVVKNAEIRAIANKVQLGEELTQLEREHLNWLNVAIIFGGENIFRLWEEGLIDDEVWMNFVLNEGGQWFLYPPNREFLENRQGELTARFRQAVFANASERAPL